MSLDALRLEVPDLIEDRPDNTLAELAEKLVAARKMPAETGLSDNLALLFHLNRCNLTLLERQRTLQNFSAEYQFYSKAFQDDKTPTALFIRLNHEMATGFKRLLLQILQSRNPSRPHMAWCLYMALHFLAHSMLRHFQIYQEPPPSMWRDSHLLYWIGEHQNCLDELVAAAFTPTPANTLRGLYQQMLLLALSNPFHLAEGEAFELFGALAPVASLGRLLPWDSEEESDGPIVDLGESEPCLGPNQKVTSSAEHLRRFELGALLVAMLEPAPLQTNIQHQLLEKVRPHWLGRMQRQHERSETNGSCNLVIGLGDIHNHLMGNGAELSSAQMLDSSAGGTCVLCNGDQGRDLSVGQLLLLMGGSGTSTLAMVRWRHRNSEGLHLGLRYLKGLPRPIWLRRAPDTQARPAVLQSTPEAGNVWKHGLWQVVDQFGEGESLWLQLISVNSQTVIKLQAANLVTPCVSRHPLTLA